MKIILSLYLLLFTCSELARAENIRLSAVGTLRCHMEIDARPDNVAYFVYKPKISLEDARLTFSAAYAVATCQKINHRLRYWPIPLKNTQDKIMLLRPLGIFDVSTDLIGLEAKGHGIFTHSWLISDLLSPGEQEKFRAGIAIHKYFDIRFGNFNARGSPQLAENYYPSFGKYIVELSIQRDKAQILSFLSE